MQPSMLAIFARWAVEDAHLEDEDRDLLEADDC
jgi:hypothetical protein